METKSFDGGLSENLYFDNNYEQDFINIKGYEQWTQYREDWEKYCKIEKESEFPPHLEFELNYSCNLRCPMCTWAVEDTAEKKEDWFTLPPKKTSSKKVRKSTKKKVTKKN